MAVAAAATAAAGAAALGGADNDIRNLPIGKLQQAGGFLFVWVINSKYQFTLDLFDRWGYT
jgi:N6-adenosine-specific RNA methylase IME4